MSTKNITKDDKNDKSKKRPKKVESSKKLPTPTEDLIDRTIIQLPKEEVVDVIYEKPKEEKPKRKGRFEKGSEEAKQHMSKLRELKKQKKVIVAV